MRFSVRTAKARRASGAKPSRVNKGSGRLAAIAAVLFSWLAAPACAEPLDATLALSVNALTGQHQVGNGQADRLSFAPLPLLEATLRYRADSVRIEGLPPLTVGYFNQTLGGSATRLSILNATYRHAVRGGWFAGIGETVYNQETDLTARNNLFFQRGSAFEQVNGSLRESSRVVGLRFEVGQRLELGRSTIEYSAALNPSMHGVDSTRVPTFFLSCPVGAPVPAGCSQRIDTFADGESATQVDLMARVAQHVSKHGELLYGLRYINFTSRYSAFPGQLSDRNVGFAPTLGYRIKL
jgi:hypothetical protein